MKLKCNFCDPTITKKLREQGIKPSKSIDTVKDKYIKDDKGKYYHEQCYVHHLINRKKMKEEDAQSKLDEMRIIAEASIKEANDKDQFYQWIMNFYDAALPAYYCTKISKIRSGKYEKVNEEIDYKTLLDIYQKMASYLKKKAFNMKIKDIGQRMNYDLAIIVGQYGNYKVHMAKQKEEFNKKVEIDKSLEEKKRYKEKQILKKESFTLHDAMDDLLL